MGDEISRVVSSRLGEGRSCCGIGMVGGMEGRWYNLFRFQKGFSIGGLITCEKSEEVQFERLGLRSISM